MSEIDYNTDIQKNNYQQESDIISYKFRAKSYNFSWTILMCIIFILISVVAIRLFIIS